MPRAFFAQLDLRKTGSRLSPFPDGTRSHSDSDSRSARDVANRSFYKTFQVEPIETEGQLLFELGNHQWNIPRLRVLLTEILPGCVELQDFKWNTISWALGNGQCSSMLGS